MAFGDHFLNFFGKPIQSNPIQSNPIQSNLIQSNPIQSNPITNASADFKMVFLYLFVSFSILFFIAMLKWWKCVPPEYAKTWVLHGMYCKDCSYQMSRDLLAALPFCIFFYANWVPIGSRSGPIWSAWRLFEGSSEPSRYPLTKSRLAFSPKGVLDPELIASHLLVVYFSHQLTDLSIT